MQSISYVLRISYTHFETPARLENMVKFCKKAGIREVQLVPVNAMGTDGSVFPSRAAIAKKRPLLTRIIRGLAEEDIVGGYCVVRTFMGQAPDGKDRIGFKQGRVDISGQTATLHPCPLDPVYLDYIKYYYAELARTGPATILTDDDFRYEYIGGMGPTCFCPLHIREFKRRYPHKITLASLKTALAGTEPNVVKKDWMEFKRVLLVELANELRLAVHQVDPSIRVGLMLTSTGISVFEGRDQRALIEAFAGSLRPLVRPGQGCYSDTQRTNILAGLADTTYQAGLMPPGTEIQAEVDFWPHSLFNKSAQFGFDYQIKANLAVNIKKINIWPFGQGHIIDENHPFAAFMARTNPVLRRITRAIPDQAETRGIQLVYSQKAAQLRPQTAATVLYGGLNAIPALLWRWGIAHTFKDSSAVILTRDSFPMPRATLLKLLQNRNIFMDGDALTIACRMGFSRQLGVKIDGTLLPGNYFKEYFLPDARNGAAAGRYTGLRNTGNLVKLAVSGQHWRALTRLVTIQNKIGPLAMAASEQNGRRLAVACFTLRETTYLLNENKQAQFQALLAWLHNGVLPAVVRDMPDICPILLEDAATKTRVLSLINTSTGCADDFVVELESRSTQACRVTYVDDSGRMKTLPPSAVSHKGKAMRIRISGAAKLHPYQVRFIFIKT